LKYAQLAALPATALLHPGGYFTSAADPTFVNLGGSYFFTPGKNLVATAASLCPGDSGGPVYRTNRTAETIVGVNAYYSFKPPSEDGPGVSVTNWHTRLDSGARNGVATWLHGLGVRVVGGTTP
jgi:hypothetical protein